MEFIISTHIFVLTLSIQFKIPHERIRAGAGLFNVLPIKFMGEYYPNVLIIN